MGVFLDYLSFGSSESIYSARATTLYLDFSHQEKLNAGPEKSILCLKFCTLYNAILI